MFRSLFRASSDRSPWGDFWFKPVSQTIAGASVSAETSMQLGAVYACVKNISEDFAKLPFRLYRNKPSGSKEIITDHWLYRLFAVAPNDWQSPFEWREMLQGHILLRGNAFCQIVDNARGEITQLIPLHPDKVKLEMLPGGSFRWRVKDRDNQEVILPRSSVWVIRGLSSDGYLGMSPIEVQARALGVAISSQEYARRYFANDSKPTGGWIEYPGRFADKAARQAFREAWEASQAGVNRGRVAVLEMGMKYHDIGINNKDSQFLESRQFSRSEIAAMFRMPPHKIGDLTKATFSNIEQQSIEYGTDTLSPWCERWEASIERFLLTEEDEGIEVEFDLRSLMRGDAASRAAYFTQGINSGWLTRNEARAIEGFDPIDGLDEPLRPLNMVEESDAPDEIAEGAEAGDKAQPENDERLAALLIGNAARIARRIAAGNPTAADVIADALAVPLQAAQAWLDGNKTTEEPEITASLYALAGL